MTDDSGATASDDDGGELTPTDDGRDRLGRFAPGNRYSRGRPKTSFTRELRRQVHMPDVVRRVIDLLESEHTNAREVVQLVTLIAHYSDGKPVTRAVTMKLDAPNMLPVGFLQMGPDDRAAVIADLRQRALAGELGALGPGDDDDEE